MTEETVVAVFDTETHAQAAVRELEANGIPSSAISRHSKGSMTGSEGSMLNTSSATGTSRTGTSTGTSTGASNGREDQGFWSWLFGTDDSDYRERSVYNQTIETGGSVVAVRVDAARADEVMRILEDHNPVDIDERMSAFGGGTTTTTTETTTAAGATAAGVPGITTGATHAPASSGTLGTSHATTSTTGMSATHASSTDRVSADGGEEVIPLAEESLQIGKRQVNRGSTRIRRFVVETPVEETVTLRDETVSVDRRPVTGRSAAPSDAFTEKTVTVTETDEEAVVGKTARVTEEVVIHKEAHERLETVHDTVRREDVEVVRGDDSDDRSSFATGETAADRAMDRDDRLTHSTNDPLRSSDRSTLGEDGSMPLNDPDKKSTPRV